MNTKSHVVYKVRSDSLPLDDNELGVYREHISLLYPGEDEKPYDGEEKNAEDIAAKYETANKKTKTDLVKESVDGFVKMDTTSQTTAKSFTYMFGPNNKVKVDWTKH